MHPIFKTSSHMTGACGWARPPSRAVLLAPWTGAAVARRGARGWTGADTRRGARQKTSREAAAAAGRAHLSRLAM